MEESETNFYFLVNYLGLFTTIPTQKETQAGIDDQDAKVFSRCTCVIMTIYAPVQAALVALAPHYGVVARRASQKEIEDTNASPYA